MSNKQLLETIIQDDAISGKLIESLFFKDLDLIKTTNTLTTSLKNYDDGELYLQYTEEEAISLDDRKIKHSSYSESRGFGLRAVMGELTGFAFSSDINTKSLDNALKTIESIKTNKQNLHIDLNHNNLVKHKLYSTINPIPEYDFSSKVSLLKEIDEYVRSKNSFVKQVSASLAGSYEVIAIIKSNGEIVNDIRPLVRINISVTLEKNGRLESGSMGVGGRKSYSNYISAKQWQDQADEAIRIAMVNLEAVPAQAGEKTVVLGPGWPGVLLHEAVGHGLEGDFNRKKTSNFSDMIGKQVAAKGVTVIDDGTLDGRRGSLNIDDEGTPTQRTVLIEDGILINYLQDRQNARLMNMNPTGNGRRESYSCQPMPRMTNTFMLPGNNTHEDIIGSVYDGVYAANFGGGQVDITSGNFVFTATECYKIENGKITTPLKGMTLIGNGPDVMKKIKAIGNDLKLDPGVGTCGKAGQSVPVGVGQPTLLIDKITVGGTE